MRVYDGGITIASRCRNIYKFALKAYNLKQYRKSLRLFNHILFMEHTEGEDFQNEVKYFIRRLHTIVQEKGRPEDIFKPPQRPDPDNFDLDDLDLDEALSKTSYEVDEQLDEFIAIDLDDVGDDRDEALAFDADEEDDELEELLAIALDEKREIRHMAKKISIKVPKDRTIRILRPHFVHEKNPYRIIKVPKFAKKEIKQPVAMAISS